MPDESKPQEAGEQDYGNLDALLQKIYNERGYDFREYKRASIQRRVNKRLFENHLNKYEQYMELLDKNPDEYSKLFDTLLINVSEFFRDPEAWEVIANEVIPKIMSKKSKGDAIRIWSAGCAAGEEPYSMAILLADRLGDSIADYEIRIYATDIDDKALNEARRGVYPHDRLKNVKKEYLDKYFVKEDGLYRVHRNIRQMVAFGRQDLVSDAPISHLDLIICRNVLIYFKAELQNRVVIKFHYALNKNGYIFFGKSESMLVGSKLFLPIHKKWRIFEKISSAAPIISIGERRGTYHEENLIEQAIREAKKEYRAMEFYNQSIIQNISLGIIVINPGNTVMTWNTAAEEIWGLKADSVVGRNFFDIGMEERIPGIKEIIAEVAGKGKTMSMREVETTAKDGARIYMDLSLIPLPSPNNEKLWIIIIAKDVTENRKNRIELEKSNESLKAVNDKLESTNEELQAANEELETTTEELQSTAEELETSNEELQSTNEELETSNEELRSINEELETTNEELKERTEMLNSTIAYNTSIIHGMGDCLIAINKNGTISTWNPAAVQTWGIPASNTVGQNIYSIFMELGIKAEELKKYIEDAVNKGVTHHEDVFKYSPQRGDTKFFEVAISPISTDSKEPTGAMLLFKDITEDVNLRERISRQNRIISSIYTMSTLVSKPVRLCKTMEDALDISLKVTGASSGTIYLVEDINPELILTYSNGLSRDFIENRSRMRIGEGFTGTIAKNRETYFIDSIDKEKRSLSDLAREGIISMIGIPLLYKNSVVGVMELFSKRRGIFSTDDMELYSGMGEQLAVAIQLAREPLMEIGKIMGTSCSLRKVGNEILGLLASEFDTGAIWIYAYDGGEKKLKIVAYKGFPEGVLEGLTYAPDEGIPGKAFSNREIIQVPDVTKRPDGLSESEAKGFEGMSLIALPLSVKNRSVGVICMYVPKLKKRIEKEKENLLTVFSSQVALVVSSALQMDRNTLKW